ncbi:hypothetical protein GCM10011348_34040 [Marinobacterium nitratireducens]|uniref:IPT/TIG domain-containing protein n=1 Tax=Marinobacterium nitratireducens TaxID=518897 RepID=A0A918DV29_9GAMM|nr:hypothetical protein [Marinobacterium nitratireducens]GGO85459.1 hypothetical protein GCM10011348_34040 [Marinobacterium nitratireducens]
MSGKWLYIIITFFILTAPQTFAAKPVKPPAAPSSEIFSVVVNASQSLILVSGSNLNSVSAGTLAGIGLTLEGTPSSASAVFSFGTDVTDNVGIGSHVLKITTDSGDLSLSVYIPSPLIPPPPPSEPCPCYEDWENFRTSPAPNGFQGVALNCYIDDPDYTYVYFEDLANNLGWILRTEWLEIINEGYCEAYLDTPQLRFFSQATHEACATYLRDNIIVIYTDPDPSFPVCQYP